MESKQNHRKYVFTVLNAIFLSRTDLIKFSKLPVKDDIDRKEIDMIAREKAKMHMDSCPENGEVKINEDAFS